MLVMWLIARHRIAQQHVLLANNLNGVVVVIVNQLSHAVVRLTEPSCATSKQ